MTRGTITEVILWAVMFVTVWPCMYVLYELWRDRPMTLWDADRGHYVSLRTWQKERGYVRTK